jgi:dihydroneopterin aldolase
MSSDTNGLLHRPPSGQRRPPRGKVGLRDRISLRDYIEVEIGAFQQERGHLQRIKFNVVVEVENDRPIDVTM